MGLDLTLDSVAGNVHDLEAMLAALHGMTGLKAFMRFELELDHGPVPVALVNCGDASLELLEHARGQVPPGLGRICRVILEIADRKPQAQALEPNLWLETRPGPKARLAEIWIESPAADMDLAVFRGVDGSRPLEPGTGGSQVLHLGGVALRFVPQEGQAAPQTIDDPGQRLSGWHRIGLACRRLEEGVAALERAGGRIEVPPYQVLPGLREAMLRLPSGLVVQPVEQHLWRMLPYTGVQMVLARLKGRPLRYKAREV
jgi:hypothetical protein